MFMSAKYDDIARDKSDNITYVTSAASLLSVGLTHQIWISLNFYISSRAQHTCSHCFVYNLDI